MVATGFLDHYHPKPDLLHSIVIQISLSVDLQLQLAWCQGLIPRDCLLILPAFENHQQLMLYPFFGLALFFCSSCLVQHLHCHFLVDLISVSQRHHFVRSPHLQLCPVHYVLTFLLAVANQIFSKLHSLHVSLVSYYDASKYWLAEAKKYAEAVPDHYLPGIASPKLV